MRSPTSRWRSGRGRPAVRRGSRRWGPRRRSGRAHGSRRRASRPAFGGSAGWRSGSRAGLSWSWAGGARRWPGGLVLGGGLLFSGDRHQLEVVVPVALDGEAAAFEADLHAEANLHQRALRLLVGGQRRAAGVDPMQGFLAGRAALDGFDGTAAGFEGVADHAARAVFAEEALAAVEAEAVGGGDVDVARVVRFALGDHVGGEGGDDGLLGKHGEVRSLVRCCDDWTITCFSKVHNNYFTFL